MNEHPLRGLPSVNEVLETSILRDACAKHARSTIVDAVRGELAGARKRLRDGSEQNGVPDAVSIARQVAARLASASSPGLRPVINATGVVLHTNLGRAPMADTAADAARDAARGYLNLELDLRTGKRSSRQTSVRECLCRLTGAESATAVNNNAAATVIALRAICRRKEVIVSRGQLIEIGGSFRIPEIMSVSGAVLHEVGTTNITRLSDYERAVGSETGALLRVHASNYRVRGFTRSVPIAELVALGRKHGVPVIDDVGSGALVDFTRFGFEGEPLVSDSIKAGADLVLFSGDKLLGGPQAGLIVGREKWIKKIERDPLMRAFRLDKMVLAALETTLRLYLDESLALSEIPVLRLLATSPDELRGRAEKLAEQIRAIAGVASVLPRPDASAVGGGSLPDQTMPTWCVEIQATGLSDATLAERLRLGTPAVVGRLQGGKVVLDLRTVFATQDAELVEAVRNALRSGSDDRSKQT
jgi:L-seryl-tRNA(Ser) seleniumtransferase